MKRLLLFCATLTGCASGHAHQPSASHGAAESIRAIHGGVGPWVAAGYRMGKYALGHLELEAGSFDLVVTHHTPLEVQYSCIADGAAAATGASAGKLNLSITEGPRADLHTTYRKKSDGRALTLRVTSAFSARYLDVPRERLEEAGYEVLHLEESEIFEEVPTLLPPGA